MLSIKSLFVGDKLHDHAAEKSKTYCKLNRGCVYTTTTSDCRLGPEWYSSLQAAAFGANTFLYQRFCIKNFSLFSHRAFHSRLGRVFFLIESKNMISERQQILRVLSERATTKAFESRPIVERPNDQCKATCTWRLTWCLAIKARLPFDRRGPARAKRCNSWRRCTKSFEMSGGQRMGLLCFISSFVRASLKPNTPAKNH